MNEVLVLAPPLAAGLLLGAFFFGGLWWTVIKGVSSPRPALWFFTSMLLRMSVTLAGFYFVGRRGLAAMVGVSAWLCSGTLRGEVADPPAGRTSQSPGAGDQLCALVPMR